MSAITVTTNIPGDTTNAATTNAVYANIAAGTIALDSTNTQTEWCSGEHLVASQEVFNSDFQEFHNATDQFVCTSATDVVIDLGGNPMRLTYTPALSLASGQRVRIHADINVDDIGNVTLPSFLNSSQDCFYLTLYYRNGAGVYTALNSEWGYSVSNYTDTDITVQPQYVTSLQSRSLTHLRRRLRCSVTGFLPLDVNGIDRIELRARIDTLGSLSSVTFEDATLCAFVVRC